MKKFIGGVKKPRHCPWIRYLLLGLAFLIIFWEFFGETKLLSATSDPPQSSQKNKINTNYPQRWNFPVDSTKQSSPSHGSVSKSGRHVCTCLDSSPNENPLPKVPKKNNEDYNFRWLHIPKTGTSLIITLWVFATSSNDRNVPQSIDTDIDPFFKTSCTSCYDFALMQRYPLELFGHNMHLRRPFASLHTSHEPLGALSVDKDKATKQLVFFRESHARVVSAFDNNMHSFGNYGEHPVIKKKCANNVTCYASRPGQLGCMLRMLTGATCSVPSNSPHTMSLATQAAPGFQARLQRAKAAIQSMAFIGLTEEWNESLCRFHKQFGGTPLQVQFQNVRKGTKKSSVADLSPTYKDPADEAVYQFAKEEFEKRMMQQGGRCYKYVENTGDKGNKEGASCVPKSCRQLGKQCGEWPDGCGGIRICGICNMEARDSLPATWRLQCSPEGECIRTCPPWEKAGLWYRPLGGSNNPDVQEKKWKSLLKGIPEKVMNEVTTNGKLHLFPTDAVRMCVGACSGQDESSATFASKYCICGQTPTGFLKISPTSAEYQDLYSLKPSRLVYGSKPYLATLAPSDTQPKCCPRAAKPVPKQKGELPPKNIWRPGIPLADFFEAFYLGCGGRVECEKLGHKHQASVVSHDPQHHYCYLGRNHRKEKDDILSHDTREHLILSDA